MRIKALLALLGLGLALLVFAGCSDSDNNNAPAGFRNITGTVTNASTGLGQPNATVTLFQNGVQVGEPFVTGDSGEFTFSNIPEGSGYTIQVSSATGAFQTVTTDAFTLDENTAPFEIIVGSGVITGVTVSGIVGTTDMDATFTVNAVRDGVVIATTTTGTCEEGQIGPAFTLTNVPVGANTTLVVTSAQIPGVVTIFGPIDIPAAGLTGITIYTKTAEQIKTDTGNMIGTIPPPSGKAAVSAYINGSGTITVGNQTSAQGNPAFLNNLTASNTLTTATITPASGTPFTVQFVPTSGTVTVFRFPS